jgi:hypothetical protein
MRIFKKPVAVTFVLLLSIILLISSYSVLITAAAESGFLQSFISKQITKKQIRKYLRQSSNVKSMQSDATLRFVYEPSDAQAEIYTDMDLTASLDMSSNSIINFLRYGDEKFKVGMDISGRSNGESVKFSGELRLVNEVLYGIVNDLPQSYIESEPEMMKYLGKWYSYRIKNMQEIRKLFSNSSNSKLNSVISEEELDKLVMLLTDDVIQKRYTKSTFKTVDGVDTTCLNFKYTGAQFAALVNKISEIYSTVSTYSEETEDFDMLKDLEFGFCTDSDMKNSYKSYINMLIESEEYGKIVVEFTQLDYDHNEDLAISAPAGAQSLDEKIDSSMSNVGMDLSEIEASMSEVSTSTQECNNLGGSVFPDVTDSFNEYDSIVYSKSNGIINGYSDGCFKPYNEITREQLIAILIRGKHLPEEIQGCVDGSFIDVDMYNKQKNEICMAKKMSYVNGYTDGSFRPSQPITIEEAAKMIANVYGIDDTTVDNTQYQFNSYMRALDERNALPEVVGCKSDVALRADITEIIYRLRNNINTKESVSLDELKQC